eukprot:6460331-Amphidinium_carterae.1
MPPWICTLWCLTLAFVPFAECAVQIEGPALLAYVNQSNAGASLVSIESLALVSSSVSRTPLLCDHDGSGNPAGSPCVADAQALVCSSDMVVSSTMGASLYGKCVRSFAIEIAVLTSLGQIAMPVHYVQAQFVSMVPGRRDTLSHFDFVDVVPHECRIGKSVLRSSLYTCGAVQPLSTMHHGFNETLWVRTPSMMAWMTLTSSLADGALPEEVHFANSLLPFIHVYREECDPDQLL